MIVTEKKIIKIDRDCKESPVFISWLNTLGGREHWLFHKVQTNVLNTSENGDFEPFVEDLETSRGQIKTLSVKADPLLIVNAMVDIEDIEGIKTLLYSPCVERLMNPDTWESEAPIWQTYRPVVGSFKLYDTNEVRATIEITLRLPYINNQTQ